MYFLKQERKAQSYVKWELSIIPSMFTGVNPLSMILMC